MAACAGLRFGVQDQEEFLAARWLLVVGGSETVVRGSFGIFYDHFRLGLARDIPAFGGANLQTIQPLSYPRLFYGVPTIAPALFGLCLSQTETDATWLLLAQHAHISRANLRRRSSE